MNLIKPKRFIITVWSYKYVILTYLIVLVLCSPLFSLCKSAVPSADDFWYGVAARHALDESGSVFKAIGAAAQTTFEKYMSWQGTYSSIFIMSLQPAIFSLKLYRISSFLLLIIFFLCPFFLAYVLNRFIFKKGAKVLYVLSALFSFLSLQFWASMLEGIYWFNAAWYYTFSFDMVLLLISVTVIFEKTASKKGRITSFILMLLFSFFLGGTNYPQLLLLTVGYTFFIIMIFLRKNPKKWMYAINWMTLGLFIAANVFAPGNYGNYGRHVNIYYTGLKMIDIFTSEVSSNAAYPLAVAVLVICFPLIVKMVKNAEIRFLQPIYFAVASFLIVFSMYTPAAFVFHNAGGLRQINIRMVVTLFMIFTNVINGIGFVAKKEINRNFSLNPIVAAVLIIMLFGASFSDSKIMKAWSIQAEYKIMGLEVSNFTVKMDRIFDDLENDDLKIVDLSNLPTSELFMSHKNCFKDYNVRTFYNKDEIRYNKE